MMLRFIISLLLLINSISVSAITFDTPKPSKNENDSKPPKSVVKPKPPKNVVKPKPPQNVGTSSTKTTTNQEINESPVVVSPSTIEANNDDSLLSSLDSAERKTKENVEDVRKIKNALDSLLVQMDVDINQISNQDSVEKINTIYSRFQENMNTIDEKLKTIRSLLSFIKQSEGSVSLLKISDKGMAYVRSIQNQLQDANNLNEQVESIVVNLRKNWQKISDIKISYEKKMQENLDLQRKKEKLDASRNQRMKDIQQINQQNAAWIGKSFKDCQLCPEMVVVPAGQFFMGSREGEGRSDEQPQHEVFISKPFAVSKFEVTFAEWDFCVADGGCFDNKTNDGGWGRDQRPVIFISWNDAKNYIKWLSRKTGKNYRLLTEAEWEYVARANTNTKAWWGEKITPNIANCDGCGSIFDNKKTAPVNTFAPNKFGIVDILGNVYEWVEDCYINSYNEASADAAVFASQCDEGRVLRGGSWSTSYEKLRSAIRKKASPITQMDDYGMRIARDL